MSKNLVIVLGPTAIGKTALSIALAKHYDTEIISADSRQIYRQLQIGTAVPNSHELNTVKHHMVQHRSILEYYNASNYEIEALEILNELFKSKDIVFMCGGSMLYIDTLCYGIDDLPTIDPEVRKEVISRYEKEGIDSLRHELKRIDPEYYLTVDLKNYKRILHALEVYYMTGRKYSSFRSNTKKERDFNIIKIGLNINREELHKRINKRVDKMIEDGLVDEARSVYDYRESNALNTVGYKEIFEYFDGNITINEAIELIKRNSRRYARKQLSWFNRDSSISWFAPNELDKIIVHIDTEISQSISE